MDLKSTVLEIKNLKVSIEKNIIYYLKVQVFLN